MPDYQLAFLAAIKACENREIQRTFAHRSSSPSFQPFTTVKAERWRRNHGCSVDMLHQIDTACIQARVSPHAVLSGHAHNFQRYTRTVKLADKPYQVPFVVCGDGGLNSLCSWLQREHRSGAAQRRKCRLSRFKSGCSDRVVSLQKHYESIYAYLRITVDGKQLKIGFRQVGTSSVAQSGSDCVTFELQYMLAQITPWPGTA